MADRWRRLRKWAKWAIGIFALLTVISAISGGSESGDNGSDEAAKTTTTQTRTAEADDKSKDAPSVDKNSRLVLDQTAACKAAVDLTRQIITRGEASNFVELADSTTTARDLCDDVRSRILQADTDHFDNEAAISFHAVDRWKSGLNAILAYIDNPRPTKIVEPATSSTRGQPPRRKPRTRSTSGARSTGSRASGPRSTSRSYRAASKASQQQPVRRSGPTSASTPAPSLLSGWPSRGRM